MLDLPEFPSYRVEERLQELRRLGLSPPVVRLAMFDPPVPGFQSRCGDVGPFDPEWSRQQPPGPPLTYLWRDKDLWNGGEAVIGAWIRGPGKDVPGDLRAPQNGQVEFIKFWPADRSNRYRVIAHSEQGLLAFLFAELLGDTESEWRFLSSGGNDVPFSRDEFEKMEITGLAEGADVLGFRYFLEIHSFWQTNADRSDYPEILVDYTRSIG